MAISHRKKIPPIAVSKDSQEVYRILYGWKSPCDNTTVLSVFELLFLTKRRRYSLVESFWELTESGFITVKTFSDDKLQFTFPPPTTSRRDVKTGLPLTIFSQTDKDTQEKREGLVIMFRIHVKTFIYDFVENFSETQKNMLKTIMVQNLQVLHEWSEKINKTTYFHVSDDSTFVPLIRQYADEYLLACPMSNGCDELLIDFFETLHSIKESL